MAGLDPAHRARARAHHQRFGAGAGAAVANALQDVAVGDAAGGEEDVVAGAEVVGCEDPVEVVAGVDRGAALLVVARPEPAEQLSPPRPARARAGGRAARGGAPPTPQSKSTGERSLTASRAAETSPSVIRRMRAPASRTSTIASLCLSRSSMTTVTSPTLPPLRSAISFSVSGSGRSRSSRSAISSPPAIFSM